MKPNAYSHLRCTTALLLIICCATLSSCKTKKPTNAYEGNWKLTYFSDSEVPHNVGPPPQPSKNIFLRNDTIFWHTVVLTQDTLHPVIDTTKYYKIEYSVVTTMSDNSVLTIAEKYVILDDARNIVKEYNYSTPVAMKSGQTSYGSGPNDVVDVDADHIRFYSYYWTGPTAYFMDRRLEKIK